MRQIIRRTALAVTITTALISASFAQETTKGCFARSYPAQHMAAHPGQQVKEIRVRQYDRVGGADEYFDIRVRFRDDPREFSAPTYCHDMDGRRACMIECDGGVIYPAQTSDGGLRLTTSYLRADTSEALPGQSVGDGECAGPVTRSIADQDARGQGIETVFVLQPRQIAECDWQ
ncbi:MAG: hypothetical protein DI616_11655 [Paracoccus denitrificans]|uniref:Uncharacterized protein n=1 Tax=Paracoccus denitrificans TaxID=266 RepID=A0A533I6J6_PARDE|nr:MAG: hypothetical protein DI616_11655 [Paracoccus denitrificans]